MHNRQSWAGILLPLGELIIGVLLLINPAAFTRFIIIGCGLVLMAMGLAGVIRYFRLAPAAAAMTRGLANGLAIVAVGAFCTFGAGWFIATFPVLTVIFGAGLLMSGLYKIQRAVDLMRLERGSPLFAAVNAGLTIIISVVIIVNPFATIQALWTFIGIVLIAAAILDLIPHILALNRKGR